MVKNTAVKEVWKRPQSAWLYSLGTVISEGLGRETSSKKRLKDFLLWRSGPCPLLPNLLINPVGSAQPDFHTHSGLQKPSKFQDGCPPRFNGFLQIRYGSIIKSTWLGRFLMVSQGFINVTHFRRVNWVMIDYAHIKLDRKLESFYLKALQSLEFWFSLHRINMCEKIQSQS